MYDYVIFVPTFNRCDLLEKILLMIRKEAVEWGMNVLVLITDDCSDFRFQKYPEMCRRVQIRGTFTIIYHRNEKNYGRKWFWKTWNRMIKDLKGREFRYFIAIPDDHMPCSNFLYRIVEDFESIRRKDKIAVAMNILVNSLSNWRVNRFVDGAFIAKREFFAAMGWSCRPVSMPDRAQIKTGLPMSSGVGQQMTRTLAKHKNMRIAKVRNISYLKPIRVESRMFPPLDHPKRPKVWGLDNFVDDIGCTRKRRCDLGSLVTAESLPVTSKQ